MPKGEFVTPFIVVETPLDGAGRGPETDPRRYHRTVWRVWDGNLLTVKEFDDCEDAHRFADICNNWLPEPGR